MAFLVFRSIEGWPPLAWLARCDARTGEVSVLHGRRVETTREWFCEAAWDGPYEAGDFDQTDIVTGSGGRVRDGGVTFVASGALCDRLHSFEDADRIVWISNSLPCLLQSIGGEVDPTDTAYGNFFLTIRHGIDKYNRWLQTSAGPVQLTYFDNLRWDDDGATTLEPKPFGDRTFPDFASYRSFLAQSMAAIMDNACSTKRAHALRPLSTLSSGYDSTTITVLAREAGLEDVLTFTRGFDGPSLGGPTESDSGAAVARMLGLRCHAIDPADRVALQEVPFFAANASGEDVQFTGAARQLEGRLLFTGYYGDRIWGNGPTNVSPTIVRRGVDGLSLSEFRLWAGFLNCVVPFWATRSIAQIHAITHSAEMKPWDVPGGYSRPICRRIIEEAGIPRGAYAVRKRASGAFPLWRRSFLSASSAADYVRWLRAERGRWMRSRRVPPPTSVRLDSAVMSAARLVESATERVAWSVATRTGWSALPHYPAIERLRTFTSPDAATPPWIPKLRRHVFPWALARAKARYLLPDHPAAHHPASNLARARVEA